MSNPVTGPVTTDGEIEETVTLVDSATGGYGSINIIDHENTLSETALETETEGTNESVETVKLIDLEIVDDETKLVPQLESETKKPANKVVSKEYETETLTMKPVTETVSEETSTEIASEETKDNEDEGSGTKITVSKLVDPVTEENVAVY